MSETHKEAERSSDRRGEVEIDLAKVGKAVSQFWAVILVAALVCALLGFVMSSFLLPKKYVASVEMIVNTSSNADIVTNDEVNSAKNLVSTYSFILTGSNVLQKVIDELGLDISYETLAKQISVEAVTDTQVFTVSVVTDNVETSKDIIREIVKIAPAEIERAVEAGSCKIVSDLDYQNTPVSPSVPKFTVAAALIGFLLSLAYALFRVMSRNYLVTEQDILETLEVPVLGVIPLF